MSSRLTVIFYIILCLQVGVMLVVLPWVHVFGISDWGDNYLLLYASQKIGSQGLQRVVASGWVRGAVTGLGLINLAMAFWEMAHFRQTVRDLEAHERKARGEAPVTTTTANAVEEAPAAAHTQSDASRTADADYLPDNERRDDPRDHS
ncbi:MAG TPA: hypothetical protein VGV59_06960 [Pyrinomonadaceae bacterium]|nr:hypothetical protein [Pyrinomonadaceae bacterium]